LEELDMQIKRLVNINLIACLMLAAAIPALAQNKGAAARSDDTAEIKAFLDRYYAAWNTLDLEKPDPFYARDANVVFFDIAPLQYNSWEDYKQGVKQLFTQYSNFKLIPNKDVRVVRRGDVAWVTLTFHISAWHKTKGPFEVDCRHTAVLEKRDNRWLVVHEHISAPLPE
jgi:uncharacterized protein (TIGR02246 family)